MLTIAGWHDTYGKIFSVDFQTQVFAKYRAAADQKLLDERMKEAVDLVADEELALHTQAIPRRRERGPNKKKKEKKIRAARQGETRQTVDSKRLRRDVIAAQSERSFEAALSATASVAGTIDSSPTATAASAVPKQRAGGRGAQATGSRNQAARPRARKSLSEDSDDSGDDDSSDDSGGDEDDSDEGQQSSDPCDMSDDGGMPQPDDRRRRPSHKRKQQQNGRQPLENRSDSPECLYEYVQERSLPWAWGPIIDLAGQKGLQKDSVKKKIDSFLATLGDLIVEANENDDARKEGIFKSWENAVVAWQQSGGTAPQPEVSFFIDNLNGNV